MGLFPQCACPKRYYPAFAVINIFFGAGDYMNMYNAWRQMPKDAMTQLSGFHSYW